jgi:mRNA interferase MazF
LRRGDLVTVAMQGDFGKPRPALVIQSDLFNDTHATVTVALLSCEVVSAPIFRITVDPSLENGLGKVSQIQIDKIMTVRRERVGETFGRIDADTLVRVNRALAVWLGVA